ncbi:YbaB/EbfC family nucleoid-associated protein [Nocardia sp. NPDC051832]|uniref:YbaB/EbfC family nucleoid-associated protein n=1 Tax=Nocardia sp. NPDC051832 TaxID=3155673 RepID=UPI003432BCDD
MAGLEGEALRARNDALRGEVDSLLATFEQQQREFAAAQARLATATVTAWSTDKLIRVTANSAGVPIEVHVDPEAFKRTTPEKLGGSITEATQAAAKLAGEEAQRAFGSVEQLGTDIPDLSDLVPGAPSIKDLVRQLLPDPEAAPAAPAEPHPEDEDEYYRNRTYLEGGQ